MEVNFKEKYRKGDIVYLVRYIENVGIQEVKKLKLRTIESDYMVGNEDKGGAMYVDANWANNLFPTLKEAKDYLSTISKLIQVKQKQDIPTQLEDDDDDKESDNIYSYIDGDIEENEVDDE